MTDIAIAVGIVLVLVPAILGWLILFISIRGMRREDKRRKELDAKIAEWCKLYAHSHRTVPQRRRELRAVAKPDCEIVTLGPDGPRAA